MSREPGNGGLRRVPGTGAHPSGIRSGDRFELEIVDLTHAGSGVGRHRDVAVFVPLTCPGDKAVVQVGAVHRDFLEAKLLELKRPSPDRVPPPCPVFGACGGCRLQHISYARQVELKTEIVREALFRVGRFEDTGVVLPAIGMDEPWGYRNKAQFPVASRGGRPVIGFYATGTHHLVPVDRCPVQHPTNNRILSEVRKLVSKYGLVPYDERRGDGFLRHVLAKVAEETGQAMVTFVTNASAFPHERDIAREMTNRVPGLVSVSQNVNTDRTNVILGRGTRIVLGEPAIEDRTGGLRFRISATSFAQVNPEQAGVLDDRVLAYAGLTAAHTAVDAYCGVGTMALLMAVKAGRVYGIENSGSAISDARENARINRLRNVEFIQGDVEKVLPEIHRRGIRPDVLVLDPPRKGVDHRVVVSALRIAPPKIIYVSCEPATMARDLAKLAAGGYRLVEVQPVDMFPHTHHVECVTLMSRL